MTQSVLGKDLKVGDVVTGLYWSPTHNDVITSLEPYNGPLAYLWPDGAQIARFALCKGGMTIDNEETFEVVRG